MIVTVEEMAKSVTNSIFASDFLQPSEKLSTLVQLVLNEFNLDAFQKVRVAQTITCHSTKKIIIMPRSFGCTFFYRKEIGSILVHFKVLSFHPKRIFAR